MTGQGDNSLNFWFAFRPLLHSVDPKKSFGIRMISASSWAAVIAISFAGFPNLMIFFDLCEEYNK